MSKTVKDEAIVEFDVLPDVTHAELNAELPTHVQHFVTNLKQRLEVSFRVLEANKICHMQSAKNIYERNIRKFEYEVGDWVLCNHPRVKKGL